MKKFSLFFMAMLVIVSMVAHSQRTTVELSFTAVNSTDWVQLDSIKVMNRTQGDKTMMHWPDTTLALEINQGDLLLYVGYATFSTVGISEENDAISSFSLYQNFPNPIKDRSEITMYIPDAGTVHLTITDLQGKVVLLADRQLDGGQHSFMFHPGSGHFYLLTVHWNGVSRSIRMISTGQQDGKSCRLDYMGFQSREPDLKDALQVNDFIVRQSGILDSPEESTTYTFQFATNIPCPGTTTVEYEGQVYNTIQIFSQCWLKENLNVGRWIPATMVQTNNGSIEKYCYNDEPDSCAVYGGLYQWTEMMQYTSQEGAQGICPQGWHVPTHEEWKLLEGAVDSQFGIGDPEWDLYWNYRGFDAGTNLKNTSGWWGNGSGTDLYGFSGLAGGFCSDWGIYGGVETYGIWWTSKGWLDYFCHSRRIQDFYPGIYSDDATYQAYGFSVRCIRDN